MVDMSMIEAINSGLEVALAHDPAVIIFGQDVGYFGGVFRATEELQSRYGRQPVFDAPISEGGIVATAVGMGAYGKRPVVEIQFADYIYPATDQLISEAARLRYRTGGEWWSPTVRDRAKELGIDLAEVAPTIEGRVRHSDLDAFITYNQGYRAGPVARPDVPIKVEGLRRRIAEKMAASKRHIPHFSYVEEIDVTDLEHVRAGLNEARGERRKLTILPFLIVATCGVLPNFPMLNARYDDDTGVVTHHGAVHMGVATQTPTGLMVPVDRNAQSRNLWQLAWDISRLAEASRSGAVSSVELSGSTLTITSLGPLGGVATTPVINRPEVAILGPNRIVERCVFVPNGMGGERAAKRKLMNISISCDHRVVDGWDAASFVQALKRLVQNPSVLLAPQ